MITSAPLWSVLVVPVLLAAFTAVAVTADALLAARAGGRRLSMGVVAAPVAEVPRLLAAQRRTTLAPDSLLWRLGLATVPVAGVLAAVVIPFGQVTASRMSVGVVWFNAMEVLTWAGLWMAGWGPNSVAEPGRRVPVRGPGPGLRAAAHVRADHAGDRARSRWTWPASPPPSSRLWFAVWMPVAFAVYLVQRVRVQRSRARSATPLGRDLAGGVLAELSGPGPAAAAGGPVAAAGRRRRRWRCRCSSAAGAGPLLPDPWRGRAVWIASRSLVLGLLLGLRRRLPVICGSTGTPSWPGWC